MKLKSILFLAMILFSTQLFAQDYRFENKNSQSTETISFTLKSNKIIDGEWEHVSNDPNASGEVYSFTGKKVGNTFIVKFPGTIPCSTPGNSRNAEWILNKKELSVPTKEKKKINNVRFKQVPAFG